MPSHYGGNGRMNGNGRNQTTRSTTNDNPVTELFNAPQSPRYYRPNGNLVPIGAPLHRHQDGTIMTEHSMGLNDNSVVVTTVRSNMRNSTSRQARANNSGYVIQSSGAPYHGRVLSHGGELYSTHTGALEGNSQILTKVLARNQRMNQTITNVSGTRNPNSSRRLTVGTSAMRRRTRRPMNNGRTTTPRRTSNVQRQRTQRTASTQMRRAATRRSTTMTPRRSTTRRSGGGGY